MTLHHPMQLFLPPFLLAGLTSGTYLLAQISSETKIPLGEAVGGFVFIAGLVWWLARKLQKLEDSVNRVEGDLKSRPCQLKGECRLEKDTDDS